MVVARVIVSVPPSPHRKGVVDEQEASPRLHRMLVAVVVRHCHLCLAPCHGQSRASHAARIETLAVVAVVTLRGLHRKMVVVVVVRGS